MDKETPFAKCHELDITGTSPEAPDEGSSSDSSAELLHMVRLLPSPEKLVNVADDEEKEMSGLKSIARVTRMRSLLKISTEEQVPFILGALSAPDFLTTSDNSNESAIGEKAVLDWEHQCTVSRE
jgi:tRNA(Ile)-lysidine synthase TilS/MesJ